MAFDTIGGNIALNMVGIGCGSIVFPVAIDAFNPQRFKPEQRGRRVAFHAICQ
jgi:hypothetical protein